MVIDEGVLFRTSQKAFVQTKRRLLEECDVWCIVSLPPKVFVNAGASSKTNLLFFTKGHPTERIWYYDLSDINVTKKSPLTLAHFEEFCRLLPERADSERSWTVSVEEIRERGYDMKAINPHRVDTDDIPSPEELHQVIYQAWEEVGNLLRSLQRMSQN